MSPSNNALILRQAIIAVLRAAPEVVARVPSNRIYGEESPAHPTWPFIRYGFSIDTPYEQSCGAGSEHRVQIDAFAYGPGTDEVRRIESAIIGSLNDDTLDLPGLTLVACDWIGTNTMRDDPIRSEYHAAIEFTVQVLEAEDSTV